jgi:hypothetical protein
MKARARQDHDLGLECAWPEVSAPRRAQLRPTVHGARLVTFLLWILAGLGYRGGVSERGQ